jgi:hypothetical protein
MTESDILIFDGGEVKSLGDGRFGGWAVLFNSVDKSSHMDRFDANETDFGVDGDEWKSVTAPVMFHHGLDPKFGKTRIGQVQYEKKALGVWAEGILKVRKNYEQKYADDLKDIEALIAAKALGLSTGVPAHMVSRRSVSTGNLVETWPLDCSELSLTHTPAEPRTLAVSLKSLFDETEAKRETVAVPPPLTIVELSDRLVADATEIKTLLAKSLSQRQAEGRGLSRAKWEALKALVAELTSLCEAATPRVDPRFVAALHNQWILDGNAAV